MEEWVFVEQNEFNPKHHQYKEQWEWILPYLSEKDISNMRIVCKTFHTIISHIWKQWLPSTHVTEYKRKKPTQRIYGIYMIDIHRLVDNNQDDFFPLHLCELGKCTIHFSN